MTDGPGSPLSIYVLCVKGVAPFDDLRELEIAQPAETSTFDLHPPVVLMKGSHEPAFFISWRSERDVVASLGWKSSLMIWGGPALTLSCTYFLLARFGVL